MGASLLDSFFIRSWGGWSQRATMLWGWHGAFSNDVAVMTFAALLSAQLPSVDGAGDGLAALLPVAGMTLLERQAQEAATIGVQQLLVLVDAVPAALTAAVDRIRARGQEVTIVRDGAAVMAVTAGGIQRVILVADGLIAPRSLWEALAGAAAPRLLAVSDSPATAALERIDVERRWAGLAMVDGAAIRALADLPPDWDPQLALLRGMIQAEAPSIPCEPQLFERGDIALLDRADSADLIEQRLLTNDADAVIGLTHANLAMPIARAAARLLLRWQHSGLASRLTAFAGAAGAVGAMLAGYPALAAAFGLIGVLAQAAAATIGAFRPEGSVLNYLAVTADILFAAAVVASAWAAGAEDRGHMLIWLASGVMIVQMLLLGRWLADRDQAVPKLLFDNGLFWLVLVAGLLLGYWPTAIVIAAPLAAGLLLIAVYGARLGEAV